MAKSVLDITIKLIKEGGADKETVKGLVAVKKSLMEAASVAGTFVAAGYAIKKALDATVGTLVAYADQVRRVQNATGASAEDASKLIQILDDQKISYEQLEKAIQKSGKAYDFSIAGIAKMSDEYLRLQTSQEKAAFMQERFGKAWISFAPLMKQGGDAIREQADAVSEGLVITQDAVDQAREYEVALDNWNDSVMALKVSIGSALLPAINNLIGDSQSLADTYKELTGASALVKGGHGALTDEYKAFQAQMERGKAMTAFYSAGLKENGEAATENAEAVQQASAAHQSMLGLIGSVASETKSYADKQAELTANMAANRAEADKLYPSQKAALEDLNSKYEEMEKTYDANAAAHSAAMGKIQFDLLVTKLSVDGLTDAEFAMVQQAGLMFKVFDQGSINSANAMNDVADAVEDGTLRIEDMQKALEIMASGDYSIDVAINTVGNINMGNLASNGQSGYSLLAGGNVPTNRPPSTNSSGSVPGFAEGGIASGPAAGHWELLHGTEAVIPLQSGSVPVSLSGGTSGNTVINLTYAPGFSTASAAELENNLMPLIMRGVREARR